MRTAHEEQADLRPAIKWLLIGMITVLVLSGCDGPTSVEQPTTVPGIDISHHNIDNYDVREAYSFGLHLFQ